MLSLKVGQFCVHAWGRRQGGGGGFCLPGTFIVLWVLAVTNICADSHPVWTAAVWLCCVMKIYLRIRA